MSKIIICADLHLHNTRQFSNRIDWLEVGINVFKLVRGVGWEIHKISKDRDPATFPNGILVGMLLVG